MDIKNSNLITGIGVIILAVIFAILSQITKNYLWLLPACIILLAYIVFFFYYWNKLREKNEGKSQRDVTIPGPWGEIKFTGIEFILVIVGILLFIFGIAALAKGNDPYQMYKDTLDFIVNIAQFFNNTTAT